MELLAEVTIPQYVRLVTLSESRRATYYEKGKKKLPKKYERELNVNYKWTEIGGKTFLTDAWGTKVVSNPNSVGQPKGMVIRGNALHSLTMKDFERSKILKAIKAQFTPIIEKLDKIEKFPLRILCEIHDTAIDYMYIDDKSGLPKETTWDIDNRALFYMKVFPDILQGSPTVQDVPTLKTDAKGKIIKEKKLIYTSKRIIPNDDRYHITQPPVPLFCPIENTDNRKLVFKIYHDDRDIVKNDKSYAIHREKSLQNSQSNNS